MQTEPVSVVVNTELSGKEFQVIAGKEAHTALLTLKFTGQSRLANLGLSV